ncbi:MAG: DNA topoisomerase, partial [candidate division WOR-3 bacterium]
ALDPEDLKSLILTGEVQYLTTEHVALYELIFNRFIASQMRPVRVREKLVKVRALDKEQDLSLRVEILLDGWNRLVSLDIAPDVSGIIDVTSSKRLKIVPEAFPYTQGELVLEMKEKGIGRPSTYASIIEKLFEREYIVERKGYIFPTELGKRVYRFLTSMEKIKEFLSEDFTRELESLMDKVEEGKVDFQEVLLDIYEKLEDIKRMFN